MEITETMKFTSPLEDGCNMEFGVLSKVTPTKGNMAWEYNPLRNYRLSEPKYYFRGKYFTDEELLKEFGSSETKLKGDNWNNYKKSDNYPNGIRDNENDPEFFDVNLLVDFETDELNFDLSNPVDILPQWSYDGSVNLILNDGKNIPRLINTRFSPLGKNLYLIVDRKGNNDTNIYDLGDLFDIDSSLYKTYTNIPEVEFVSVGSGGNLSVGNYHFYFKYTDTDGNETDFVAESGLVSIFKGSSLSTVVSGFRNENAYKSVRFILSNIDPAYQYVNIYYTKSSADIYENSTTLAFKIELKYLVNNSLVCSILITGDEQKLEIPLLDINPVYLIALNVLTQEQCLNMLFFGNVQKLDINYKELADLSLRFCALIDTSKEYSPVGSDYNRLITNTYSDPMFIYNFTGYLNKEIYRFGVVYLMDNGTLSPVFNIRGMYFTNSEQTYTKFPVSNNGERIYISYNEDTGIVYKEGEGSDNKTTEYLENAFGVVRVFSDKSELHYIRGIKIELNLDNGDFYKYLKSNGVKGVFFVRLKRLPLRVCLAYTIGVDLESNTPLLYVNSSKISNLDTYIAERFVNNGLELVHNIEERFLTIDVKDVGKYGAICPEYDVNSPYLNSLFCGDSYIIEGVGDLKPLLQSVNDPRHFYVENSGEANTSTLFTTRVLGVEDNVKLVSIDSKLFSARAGEAEEAFRFEFVNRKNTTSKASNLLRGSFGPYIALDGYNVPGSLINIYLKDYLNISILDLFRLRYNDKSSFYAVSDRISLLDLEEKIDGKELTLYRGDSYICTFTHRVNRNFQDPSAPTNDKIVDYECWKDNFEYEEGILKKDKFDKVNLGDVNAVKLGMWVTFSLVSSINLNIRSLDESIPDETALTGHPRGFYPYSGMLADGSYKTPEALCYNKCFDKSLSERWNYEVPDVPAIKNDFTNRISYSDIHVNDAFKNGYRVFQGSNYRDYPKTYGRIVKLVELRGNLVCVFEHGVALIPVNERTLTGEGSGGTVYVNTSNVLPENPKILSDIFGSQWKESVIKTPKFIYGVDTVGKKIWRTDGNSFECISDFKVLEFLNQNISLTERELDPIIGIRNVKSHYNKFKQDVMFTFYDNLYGFEEKVWNLCFNEVLLKWITFYSWVPSYSENIYNLYFSFDRNTSKWIAKLGISKADNDFSDGVVLSNNIIPNNAKKGYKIGTLSLANRTLPSGEDIEVELSYEPVRDSYGNKDKFKIVGDSLYLDTDATNLCSEFYVRGTKDAEGKYIKKITDPENLKEEWINNCVLNSNYVICKDDRGRRESLNKKDDDKRLNASQPVILLNVRCNIKVTYKGESTPELQEAYISGFKNGTEVDAGYYQSVIAIIPEYNKLFLTTDFWRHGLAGIIDIADEIYPTYWYGKQHPFEFEFVMADTPSKHKIFDNLLILSNKAAPESFHYEIVGECYDFAKDKKNMYIRQEATKELYQYNGSNIVYNSDYKTLNSVHRPLYPDNSKYFDKSTILPLYYSRQDSINDIEDHYHQYGHKDSYGPGDKNFSALAGGEIVRYKNLDEYRIWNHAKAVDIAKEGPLRGNMYYKEDIWDVQINPLNIMQRNEDDWKGESLINGESDLVPIEINQCPVPDDIKKISDNISTPADWDNRGITVWKNYKHSEAKLKDKYIKIRIRYSGEDLAIISAIKTLFSISYA